MIRFIMRRRWRDSESQASGEQLYTVDGDVAKLEYQLRHVGHGPNGYEIHELVGVELIWDADSRDTGEGGA